MTADEIFRLIIKADERLKYATDARGVARREQARAMLEEARDAARAIGNNALASQAEQRLEDLESLEESEEGEDPARRSDQPPELEAGSVHVLEGATFMVSDGRGDVPDGVVGGLFHQDTRFLSRYELTLDGRKPDLLSSGQADYYSAGFFLANPELASAPAQTISVQRHRFVGDGLHDRITLRNHRNEPSTVELRLAFGADFADLFEVKQRGGVRKRGVTTREHDAERGRLRFTYRRDPFTATTQAAFSERPALDGDDAVFRVEIPPRGTWGTSVFVQVHGEADDTPAVHPMEEFATSERAARKVLETWNDEVPRLEVGGTHLLKHVYEQSVTDLASLRLFTQGVGARYSLPAAGLPWFMAVFGRDTLITSYQSLWVGPTLARGALRCLAELQGTESNDFQDEDPGKILHEIRYGELTAVGERPHHPYYGSHDATPLWLVLLSEYWRVTGDDATAAELRTPALAALRWIDEFGDLDGDGFVEYRTRSSQGLDNQGWKDSWDSVRFADGRLADTPLALCEIQGYVYDAKLRAAELAERVWGDPALGRRLREEAAALFDRFNERFWIDRRGGYYAMALDGGKRQVDAMTSNMGHLLWSGIVPEDRARVVARQLLSEAMFSGWGVRTMSTEDAAYNPVGYHVGTVWPHDNSIITAGLVRYGFRQEANRIAVAMFDAAHQTGDRLPEAFAGYPRGETRFPVRYPTACSPQAWATAAPFLWLRTMLGFDVQDGRVVCDPVVPKGFGRVRLHGIHALGGHVDLIGEGTSGQVAPTH